MSFVSIIVPCYNEEKTIQLLLRAVLEQTYPCQNMEVVIADGMSTDQTRQKISGFLAENQELKVRVVDNLKRNIPSGLNRAIEAAKGELLVRLDAHSMPDKEYVERCVKWLDEGKADNVGGVWQIRSFQDHWISNSIAVAAAHKLGVGDAKYRYATQPEYVDTVPFGSFKMKTIEKIGKFDEELLTNEDYELNARIRQQGGKVWLDPQIRSVYFARRNLKLLAQQYWRYGFWKYRMLRQYPQTLRWRQALPPVFVLGILSLLIAAFFIPYAGWLLSFGLVFYFLLLMLSTMPSVLRDKKWYYLLGVPSAIAVMHFCWGSGFLVSVVKSMAWKKDRK